MKRVAVIAHHGKSLGGGLPELRRVLAERGVTDVYWREVAKSSSRPSRSRRRSSSKAELIFVWGGDGMVQRCVDVARGHRRHARDHPGRHRQPARDQPRHPQGLEEAVDIGLAGNARRIDVGRLNGERFAVMAGRRLRRAR